LTLTDFLQVFHDPAFGAVGARPLEECRSPDRLLLSLGKKQRPQPIPAIFTRKGLGSYLRRYRHGHKHIMLCLSSQPAFSFLPLLSANSGRARLTQIMNLLCLAPDIQEDLLFLPATERGGTRSPSGSCARSQRCPIGGSRRGCGGCLTRAPDRVGVSDPTGLRASPLLARDTPSSVISSSLVRSSGLAVLSQLRSRCCAHRRFDLGRFGYSPAWTDELRVAPST
jgi:hypothetical protein